ncbi:MAG: ABC transporter ATP-binding protein [Actinomycetes bacterium]
MSAADTTPGVPLRAGRPPAGLVAALVQASRVAPSLRRGFGLTLLLATLGTVGQLVVPIAVQQVLDREVLTDGAPDLTVVALAAAGAVVVLVGSMAANRTALLRLVRATADGLAELRVATFRHVHDLSTLHLQAERRGVLVARVTSDVESITQFLEWGGVAMLVGTAQLTLAVVVMLVYDWRLALLVAGGAALYGLLIAFFNRVLGRAFDRVRERSGASVAAVSEAVAGLPTIRVFGIERRAQDRVDEALDAQFGVQVRAGALGAVMFSSAEVFAASLTAGVLAAGVLLGDGLTAGQVVAFLFLVTLFIDPVQTIVEVLNEAQSAAAGIRRVLEVLGTPREVADPTGGVDLPPGELGIRFRGVRFRYPEGERDVLADLDLDIEPGTRVAVVGETGSGKSTLAKVLVRLVDPSEGTVEVGGVDVRRVRFASLRRRVAFVPQEGFLFDGTIADNARYGRPDAAGAEVEEAFADLGLDAWLAEQPAGLATPVGERGSRLSSGERQLVALVRAWLTGPDLLVLDEATSAVDPALDVQLKQAIERLTQGRTSITIAHRLSTAQTADLVLVLDAGVLVEQGPHDELVAAGGTYARLWADWAAQAGGAGG